MKTKTSLLACGLLLAALINGFGQPAVWVRFSADTYSAYERDGMVTIPVCRYGDITNPFTVDYESSDGTATAGVDYLSQRGILSFAAWESKKTFTIPILDDGLGEADETVNLLLINPTGGVELFNHFASTLHIVDDYKPGSLDFSFHPRIESTNRIGDQPGWISSIIVQPDGKVLVLGSFESVNGVPRQGLARLEVDGSLDDKFPDLAAKTVALQPDGKLLLARAFVKDQTGEESAEILRLNPNGTLDAQFNLVVTNQDGSFRYIGEMLPQKNGKILVRGLFSSANGISPIAQLSADGSFDGSFKPIFRATNAVGEIQPAIGSWALREDGRILVTGEFYSVDGETRHDIAQLNVDGTLDTTFRPDPQVHNSSLLAVQGDGRVLLGGRFDRGRGEEESVVRLNVDGSLDNSFISKLGETGSVFSSVVQADGRILIGYFSHGECCAGYSVARLNSDGSMDPSFEPVLFRGGDTLGPPLVLALQSDGKIIIGLGPWWSDEPRQLVARLNGDPPTEFISTRLLADGRFHLEIHSLPDRNYVLQASANLVDWLPLCTNNATGFSIEFEDTGTESHNRRFYRAVRKASQ